MRRPLFVVLGAAALACGGLGNDNARFDAPVFDPPGTDQPSVPGPRAGADAPSGGAARRGGSEVAIVDPGMNGMTAFTFQVPAGWRVDQSFTREWPTAVPTNVVYVAATSPEGNKKVEFLPMQGYGWMDGPNAESLRQFARQSGIPASSSERQPMAPVDYARQVLVPKLAQNGLQFQESGSQSLPDEPAGMARRSRGYLEGTLGNGNHARIEAQISITVSDMGGERWTGWTVLPVIVQSPGDVGATYEKMRAMQQSVVWNPAWQQANHELTQRGIASNTENSTQQHDARMDALRASGEVRDQAFRDRMTSQDRQHEAFMDTIRGQTRYDDPTTGQRVIVDTPQTNYVFGDGQGNAYGTNDPYAAPGWQQMNPVETQDY